MEARSSSCSAVTARLKDIKGDKEARKALDRALAEAGAYVVEKGDEVFAQMPAIIQQAQEMAQKLAPPQPMDPAQAAVQSAQMQAQAKQAELQQRAATEQARLQLSAQQAAQDAQVDQARLQVDAQRLQVSAQQAAQDAQLKAAAMQQDAMLQQQREQAEDARTVAELNARMQMNTEDNRTAMELAAAEIASGEKVAVSTGTGINPNP